MALKLHERVRELEAIVDMLKGYDIPHDAQVMMAWVIEEARQGHKLEDAVLRINNTMVEHFSGPYYQTPTVRIKGDSND